MRLFAHRILGLVFIGALLSPAVAQSPHSAPLRVAPTRTVPQGFRLGNVEYEPITEFARRYGLSGSWIKRDERVVLRNDRWKIELNADSREVDLNGFRFLLGEPCRVDHHMAYLSKSDSEKLLGPILRPGYLQPSVPDLRVITIDPGHGGVDNGTQNTRLGLMEKNLTMDVAARVVRLLRADGYKVVLTRETDTKIELPIRSAVANTAGADLFISIHFNSLPHDAKTYGVELFTFAPEDVRSTDAWSGKVSDAESEPSPVNKYDHWSSVAAFCMQREMLGALKTFDRGKKIAHWGVLRSLSCPGMLVECGFLSNEAEARRIATPEYRQKIAESIVQGVRSYSATLSSLRAPAAPKPVPSAQAPSQGQAPSGPSPPAPSPAHPAPAK